MELRFLSCRVIEVRVMAEAISHPEVTWQLRNQWLHSLTGLENLQSVEASSSKCEWVSQAGASESVEPVRVSQLSRCEWVSGASHSQSEWCQSSQCESVEQVQAGATQSADPVRAGASKSASPLPSIIYPANYWLSACSVWCWPSMEFLSILIWKQC